MKSFSRIVSFICLIVLLSFGTARGASEWSRSQIHFWTAYGLTGGNEALDGISGSSIHQNDMAIALSGETVYFYRPDTTGVTDTEVPPYIIVPDTLQAGGISVLAPEGTTVWTLMGLSGTTLSGESIYWAGRPLPYHIASIHSQVTSQALLDLTGVSKLISTYLGRSAFLNSANGVSNFALEAGTSTYIVEAVTGVSKMVAGAVTKFATYDLLGPDSISSASAAAVISQVSDFVNAGLTGVSLMASSAVSPPFMHNRIDALIQNVSGVSILPEGSGRYSGTTIWKDGGTSVYVAQNVEFKGSGAATITVATGGVSNAVVTIDAPVGGGGIDRPTLEQYTNTDSISSASAYTVISQVSAYVLQAVTGVSDMITSGASMLATSGISVYHTGVSVWDVPNKYAKVSISPDAGVSAQNVGMNRTIVFNFGPAAESGDSMWFVWDNPSASIKKATLMSFMLADVGVSVYATRGQPYWPFVDSGSAGNKTYFYCDIHMGSGASSYIVSPVSGGTQIPENSTIGAIVHTIATGGASAFSLSIKLGP